MAKLAWTKQERLVLFAAWLGWTFDIMDASLFNFAKGPLVTEILGGVEAYKAEGAAVEAGLLATLMIAWSIGGVLFGWAADRVGRVKTMMVTILMYSVFTGLTSLCQSIPQLHAVRFLTGLGIGGEWAAGVALVAETVSEEKRARAAAWLQSAAAFGPWMAALANLALANLGWRALFLVGVLPAALTLFLRWGIREPERKTSVQSSRTAITPEFLRRAAIGLTLGIAGISMATNVTFWLPNMVKQLSPGLSIAQVQVRQSLAASVLHVGTLIGVFLVPALCVKFGRRLTLAACFVLGPLGVWAVTTSARDFSTLVSLAPVMAVFGIGFSAAFVLYFPEIFPANLRATGAGLSYNGGRVIAAFAPMLTAWLIRAQGDVARSVAQTSVLISLGLVALLFAPETKGARLPE